MDLDRVSFWLKLPSVLEAISEAQFVSVDLEMSGIATEETDLRQIPSLQQIYEDAKAAAETFTVLQFGLTCISWDSEKEAYRTKTFNLPVYPGIIGGSAAAQQLSRTVDRRASFSSKTIAFLQEHSFSFADVFNKGVPYLSTSEAAQKGIIDFVQSCSQNEYHIDVSQCPPQTRQFHSDVQTKLREWEDKRTRQVGREPLKIENPYGGRLNSVQKRLIYELVETEFKHCRAYSRARSAYMEIVELDSTEQRLAGCVKAQRKQAVVKQTGLRFIWDAICGQLFADKIDPELVVGEDPAKIVQLRMDLKGYERQLRNQKPIFVGHNLLWDICFLYNTFVGSLPEGVEDFRTTVRERLPRIVDTKYLFTRGGHEMLPDQCLAEYFAAVRSETLPAIQPDPRYSYLAPCPHQAGYDSYMTAVVLIKKSHQLSQSKQGLGFLAAEDSAENIALSRSSPAITRPSQPCSLPSSWAQSLPTPRRVPAVPSVFMLSPFVSTGSSLLDDSGDEDAVADLASYAALKPELPVPKITPQATGGTRAVGPAKVPDWEGTFWERFGNKSRVGPFGLILYTGKYTGDHVS